MADHRQQKQGASPKPSGRGGQIIVELCGVNDAGLVFWSRHRFEVAAELQVRIRADALPARLRSAFPAGDSGWVCVRGYVVECVAMRRAGGVAAFRVSLVFEAALARSPREVSGKRIPRISFHENDRRRIFGLN